MQLQRTLCQVGLGLVSFLAGISLSTQATPLKWSSLDLEVGQRALAQDTAPVVETSPLPAQKTTTVMVEGEPQEVTLQLYANPDMPLVTYYPPAMTTSEVCGEEGCWITFRDEELGAAVLFLFPNDTMAAADVEPFITGAQGLLSENPWRITGEFVEPQELRYPWAKKGIRFQTETMDAVGIVYLGELNGKAFAVVAVFPPDAGDGFAPLAQTILTEMQVRE